MRRIGVRERRARLGLRHRLAAGALAGDPVEAAGSLVAVHSTDPSSVYLTLLARMTGGGIADVERALYEDRTLIRLLGMRRTVFVAALDIATVIQAACSRAVAANERRKLLGWLAESGVADDVEGWLAGAEEAALSALTARGEATAAELAATIRGSRSRSRWPGAQSTRAGRTSPAGFCSSSPRRARWCGACCAKRGPRTSTAGRRSRRGARKAWTTGQPKPPRWSWRAAGWT